MAQGWVAQETSDGHYDLTRGGRAVSYGLDDVEAVKRVVRRTEGKGAKFEVVEADGYRVTHTT